MKRKTLLTIIVGISLVLVLALALPLFSGCPGTTTPTTPTNGAPPAKVYELRMQHSWGAAENHFFQQYADIVEEMSGGRIKIAVFSDGELVSMEELCDAVAAGAIDIGHTHPDYYSGVVPEGYLESAPYLWRTLEEEMATGYRYGIGAIYTEAFEEKYGYHVLGHELCDPGALMFTKPIYSLADMEGCVINVCDPYASILADLAGASATYMGPEEIYTGLATGVLDGVEYGAASAMYAMGFHDVAKYYLKPEHQVAWFPFYFINQDLWDELPPDLQAILTEGVSANATYMKAWYSEREVKALALMREAGVTVCTLPDEEVEAIFQETLKWLTEDYASLSPRCARAADICLEALRDFGRID